jgi:D-alanyl-D-alanine carboxypeptidase
MVTTYPVSLAYRKPQTHQQHQLVFTDGMSIAVPARTTTCRAPRSLVAGLLVVVAALVGGLGYQSFAASSSTAASSDEAIGAVPAGTTIFDDAVPGVARLDPGLLAALRGAAHDAADGGVTFVVDSGWRSPEYQERLLDKAVAKYGSREDAARWVATPTTSAHVSGHAVDLAHSDATAWLSDHGAAYGLCQIYGNEPWHFELRPAAVERGCPARFADPTHDPRMQP